MANTKLRPLTDPLKYIMKIDVAEQEEQTVVLALTEKSLHSLGFGL